MTAMVRRAADVVVVTAVVDSDMSLSPLVLTNLFYRGARRNWLPLHDEREVPTASQALGGQTTDQGALDERWAGHHASNCPTLHKFSVLCAELAFVTRTFGRSPSVAIQLALHVV